VNATKNVRHFINDHQLASFVTLALVATIIMTVISLRIYVTSGAIKLDLSRPGYEKVRQEVTNDTTTQPFPSSGTLTPAAIKDFRNRLDKQQSDLKAVGNFSDDGLSDSNLGLE